MLSCCSALSQALKEKEASKQVTHKLRTEYDEKLSTLGAIIQKLQLDKQNMKCKAHQAIRVNTLVGTAVAHHDDVRVADTAATTSASGRPGLDRTVSAQSMRAAGSPR